jgi:hypothetical protein
MANNEEPVVLELAPLPREQIGPFLILGVEKDADKEQVEASWARRVLGARKRRIELALEDINWAREVLNDPAKRVRADVNSLNPDTIHGTLARLQHEWGVAAGPSWRPLGSPTPPDVDPPEADVPSLEELRNAVPLAKVPEEMPAVRLLLEQFGEQPTDPWAIDDLFPTEPGGTP